MPVAIMTSEEGRKALAALAAERAVDGEKLAELLAAVARHSGMLRRRGLFLQFDTILDEATRS